MKHYKIDDSWDNEWRFPHGDIDHQVFRKGEGSGVLLMHELPGMSEECIWLAEEIVQAGFRVYLPLFFGAPRKTQPARNLIRIMCIRREFYLFSKNSSGPITRWLRGLCDEIYRQCGGPGVGAIGMCLTGGFALALMVKPSHVEAPVLSQPSIPFAMPWSRQAGLSHGVPEEAYQTTGAWAAEQQARRPNFAIPAFHFEEDRLCKVERMNSLRKKVGEQFFVSDQDPDGRVFTISAQNREAAGIPPDQTHSVLTGYSGNGSASDPTVKARRQVIEYLRQQLPSGEAAGE